MKSRRLIPICGMVIMALLCLLPGCTKSEMVGDRAPEFSLDSLDGKRISLAELGGKPVLLEFWAPWCPACRENIGPMKELHDRFADKIRIIAPSSEQGRKSVARFVSANHIPYQVAFATRQLLENYRVSAIPVTMLIDGRGIIRYRHLGRISTEETAGAIKALP